MSPVVINARFLTQPMSGVQRYAREVLTALDCRLASDADLAARLGSVRAYYPAGAALIDAPHLQVIQIAPLPGGGGHVWEQIALARASRNATLISLCGSGPVTVRNQVLVIHDANVFEIPDAFSAHYRWFHKTMRPMLARRVAALGTVSHAAAHALSPHLGVPAGAFTLIPNSAAHILNVPADPAALARFGLRAGEYLLTVGNQSPNKNIARLVAAHLQAGPDLPILAVAGGFAPGVTQAQIADSDRVRLLGRVSDPELRSLYEGAAAFVWPARREGFGIPPLEAMALGTPVLSSNTTAMPEVLGDAAQYFDPDSTDDMIRALRRFAGMTKAARSAMVKAGLEQAAGFTWESSADRLIGLLLKS